MGRGSRSRGEENKGVAEIGDEKKTWLKRRSQLLETEGFSGVAGGRIYPSCPAEKAGVG